MKYIIIFFIFFISSCLQRNDDIKTIILTIDPHDIENKYQVVNITQKDSINFFIEKLINKKQVIAKFYPKYLIEINYTDRTEKFIANEFYIKDAKGHTYMISSEILRNFYTKNK